LWYAPSPCDLLSFVNYITRIWGPAELAQLGVLRMQCIGAAQRLVTRLSRQLDGNVRDAEVALGCGL